MSSSRDKIRTSARYAMGAFMFCANCLAEAQEAAPTDAPMATESTYTGRITLSVDEDNININSGTNTSYSKGAETWISSSMGYTSSGSSRFVGSASLKIEFKDKSITSASCTAAEVYPSSYDAEKLGTKYYSSHTSGWRDEQRGFWYIILGAEPEPNSIPRPEFLKDKNVLSITDVKCIVKR